MNKEESQELLFLQECSKLIEKNIEKYQVDYEKHQEKTKQLLAAMHGGDVELYNQMMASAALEEHALSALKKNEAVRSKPYFGRINYTEEGNGKSEETSKAEDLYIGKTGIVKNKTQVMVADWRAPVASIYYENELGRGSYQVPEEKEIEINLQLKRTYDIENGHLKGYYDSDVAANDELLVQYLSKNKDAVLGDIIATIQKEQNRIIRESPFSNLVVQGVAGSGKTTVAMHRISYILYNYKDRFESNEFCIIGGSDLLLNYITTGLPELDVYNVKQMRMDRMLTGLLRKEWSKKKSLMPHRTDAVIRSKVKFMLELELFLMNFREEYIDCSLLQDTALGTILSKDSNQRLLIENPQVSVAGMLKLLDERVRTRIKFLVPEENKELLKEKNTQYKHFYQNQMPKRSLKEIYSTFLDNYMTEHPGELNAEELGEWQRKEQYDIYDVAALVLIFYRIFQKNENEEFGLLFIDEAQDFGSAVYYVLRKVLPKCYFTIMGDVSQNIHYHTGMNDWDDLCKYVLTGEKDYFTTLAKSYRNTIEISEYAGKILEKASFGRYRIEPVIRHGVPVLEEAIAEDKVYSSLEEKIKKLFLKGYQTVAVVCLKEERAEEIRAELGMRIENISRHKEDIMEKGVMVLPISLVKGVEFDAVLLLEENIQEKINNPETAKLLYVAATRALHELQVLIC